jgi:hypothetical protein
MANDTVALSSTGTTQRPNQLDSCDNFEKLRKITAKLSFQMLYCWIDVEAFILNGKWFANRFAVVLCLNKAKSTDNA